MDLYREFKQYERYKKKFLKYVQNIREDRKGQQKDAIEVATNIYNNRGEDYLIKKIVEVTMFCISFENYPDFYRNPEILIDRGDLDFEQFEKIKMFDRAAFEWSLNFLERSFNLLGAEEAEFWIRKDFRKSNFYWGEYLVERAKQKNLPIGEVRVVPFKVTKEDSNYFDIKRFYNKLALVLRRLWRKNS